MTYLVIVYCLAGVCGRVMEVPVQPGTSCATAINSAQTVIGTLSGATLEHASCAHGERAERPSGDGGRALPNIWSAERSTAQCA